jgi:hypothetical protein
MNEKICYCFNYTKKDIIEDYLKNGKSTILLRVQEEKKKGKCQCYIKNPKGT